MQRRAGACMGRAEKCMGRAEKCMGRAEKCMGRAEKCMGRAEKCMGRALMRKRCVLIDISLQHLNIRNINVSSLFLSTTDPIKLLQRSKCSMGRALMRKRCANSCFPPTSQQHPKY